jgi:Flp pilus assembly protein TadD
MFNQRRLREAVALHREGKLVQAEQAYRRLHDMNPNDSDLWHLRGLVAGELGDAVTAARLITEAIKLNPTVPFYQWNLGLTLEKLGETERAAELYNTLGNQLQKTYAYQEAAEAYRKALHLDPDNAFIMCNLAVVLIRLGHHEVAIEWLEKALTIRPNEANIYLTLGNAFMGCGWVDRAVGCYDRALYHEPDMPEAHWTRGQAQLLRGNFQAGWEDYEWRTRWAGFDDSFHRFDLPEWQGQPAGELNGTLLVASEQGFGDTIQFLRYVPLLTRRGYQLVLEVPEVLHRLVVDSFPSLPVLTRAQALHDLEAGILKPAAFIRLMSLPHRFGTVYETIPGQIPYLSASPSRRDYWRLRLSDGRPGLKIGLVWAGRPENGNDAVRSMPVEKLARLIDRPDVSFYGLQKEAILPPELAGKITLLGPELADFSHTAAGLSCLDLLISVDTSPVHLAGALGLPCWVMLAATPDWRWLQHGESSPWYPSLRLFRQHTARDWDSVLGAISYALDRFQMSEFRSQIRNY